MDKFYTHKKRKAYNLLNKGEVMKKSNKNKKYKIKINPLFVLLMLSFILFYASEYGTVIMGFHISFLIGVLLSLFFVFADIGLLLVALIILFV